MRSSHLLKSLCFASSVWIALYQTAKAEIVNSNTLVDSEPPVFSKIDHLQTSVSGWLSQASTSDSPSLIQITDVQINRTNSGLEIILKTSGGQLPLVSPSVIGNDLITNIPNTVLVLPNSEEFRAVNPSEDVAQVTVSNLPDNQVQVTITGLNEVPVANVRADETELVFDVVVDAGVVADFIEIVVTAQKTPEILQNVPISLTVLTEEEIEDADIISLDGIAGNTPNFTNFSASGSRSFTFYSIRGLSNQNFGSRDPVAFYVDDVPYDYGSFIDLDVPDIEQVEILRGPQNTLYGRSSQAGVVNITTRKPTNELSFNGSVSYGNFDSLDLRAGVSGPIIKDELFYRLSGSYGKRDGFYNNSFVEDEEYDEKSGGTGRVQILWTPSDELEVSFNASVEEYRDGAFPFVPIDDDPFDIELDFNGFNNLNTDSQVLKFVFRQPDFRVTSITTRRFSNQEAFGELDLTVADIFASLSAFESTVWTQEFRIQAPEEEEQFQWIVGGYFESREFDNPDRATIFGNDAAAVFPGTIPGTSNVSSAESQDTTIAVFGQISYRPIEDLTLTAGLRYENTDSRLSNFEQFLRIPGFPDITLASFDDIEENSDALLPRFAINYKLNPNATIYSSISSGYRPGGVNVLASDEDSLVFGAERSLNYELGFKTVWFDNRLGVNLAFFHNPVDNYQVATFDPITLLTNDVFNADVSITGFELEVRATPLEGLDITAGFGFVDSEFNDFIDEATGTNLTGNKIPYVPDFTYNLAIQYRTLSGLLARVELQGIGTTFFDEDNTLKQDPYAVVNARLGYEFDQYGLYLFANNIFDTRYITQAFDVGPGNSAGSFGAPVTYGIQFRGKF